MSLLTRIVVWYVVLTVCCTCVAQQLYGAKEDKTVTGLIMSFPSAYSATVRQLFEFTLGRLLT